MTHVLTVFLTIILVVQSQPNQLPETGYTDPIFIGSNRDPLYQTKVPSGPRVIEITHEPQVHNPPLSIQAIRPGGNGTLVINAVLLSRLDENPVLYSVNITDTSSDWTLELLANAQIGNMEVLIGSAPSVVVDYSEEEKIYSDAPFLYGIFPYGLLGLALITFVVASIVIFFLKVYGKKNPAASAKELRKKWTRATTGVAIGIVIFIFGLGAVIAPPLIKLTDNVKCCGYFQRMFVPLGQSKPPKCTGNFNMPCFLDISRSFSYQYYPWWLTLIGGVVGLFLVFVGYWVATVHIFKITRLLKTTHEFRPTVKFKVTMEH